MGAGACDDSCTYSDRVDLWRGAADAPRDWGRCVLTIGGFDGVHGGHEQVIGRAVTRARALGVPAVAMTFDPHPREIVRPGNHPAKLTGTARKAELVAALGVDVLCVQPFTLEFSRLEADEFVHEILIERLHAEHVVVGKNFRFGHRAQGTVAVLRELGDRFGFAVEDVPIVAGDGTAYSSTFVRARVDAGDVVTAARVLGREHRLEGIVVRGEGRGGPELGYPTANLALEPYAAVPADGVYAGHVVIAPRTRRERRFTAAISIGTNPTFDGRERTVEAHLLDFDENIYGETIGIEFAERLRGTVRFDSVPALITQMGADVAQARELLA